MKKIYKMLWLLALLAVMPIANVVAQNVAKIGDTPYTTLADAVAAVPTDGTATTITMTANTTETAGVVVAAGQNVVIDLKGKNITGSVNGKLITNNGILTIKGTGCVYNQDISAQGHDAVYNTGTLVVNGGIFGDKNSTKTDANDVNRGAAVRNYGGTATINGGSFTACDNFTNGGYAYALINDNNGTMTINNATVYGKNNGNIANNYGSVTVKGGTYTLDNTKSYYSLYVDGEDGAAVTTVEGGTFNNTTNNGLIHTDNATNASVEIEGGSFTYTKLSNQTGTDLKLEVSGGSFPTDVTAYMESGSTAVQNGDGNYVINPVAQIGSTYYCSLADAVAAVPTDGTQTTITMLADETITTNTGVTIPAGANVVLELNGKTITQTSPGNATGYLIKNNGTLTIQDNTDSDMDGTGNGKMQCSATNPDTGGIPSYANNLISNYGTLNIVSGYYEVLTNAGYASYVVDNYSGATANITGGKLTNNAEYAYVVRMFLNSTTANNALNISGTAHITGSYAVWMQYANANANKASLNISGGTIEATQGYAVYAGSAGGNSRNATNISVSITGGDIEGTGAWFGTDTAFESFSVTGGTFANFGVGAAGGNGLVSGGTFKSTSLFTQTRDDSTPLLADGYEVEDNGNGEYEVVHITEYVINDGDAYTFTSDVTGVTATYKRSFGSDRVKKYQGWFVPFDYTITAADLQKFKFFQINMIAHSATEGSTETTDPNKLWIHLIPMAENGVLKANTPYIFTPQEVATDYEFTTTNATLKALTTGSVASCSTMTEEFNFYGVYSSVHPEDASDIFYYMAKSGQISRATKTSTTVGANRWIFRVTPKDGSQSSVSYSIGFVVNGVEDDDVTAVSSAAVEAEGEVVGYYTLNGQKVSEPTKGVYVVKYANGTSKKVVF